MGTGRRNRVLPDQSLVAVPGRGTLWGNRGPLLNRHGELARDSAAQAWIACVLEFRGRRRTQWRPGRLTELYFLDEATALAAGHRPCAECRRPAYRAYQERVPGGPLRAPELDGRLADERRADGRQRLHRTGDVPDGCLVTLDDGWWLVAGSDLLRWTPSGYADRRARPRGPLVVLTPPTTQAVLAAGYRAIVHPSAGMDPDRSPG